MAPTTETTTVTPSPSKSQAPFFEPDLALESRPAPSSTFPSRNRDLERVLICKVADDLGLAVTGFTGVRAYCICPACGAEGQHCVLGGAKKFLWRCYKCGASGNAVGLVMGVRGCDSAAAFRWLEEKGFLPPRAARLVHHEDSLHQLAHIRGWRVEALQALGARAEGKLVVFPMRDHQGKETGQQKRRGDNSKFGTKGNGKACRSLSAKGSKHTLFYPLPFPTEGRVLVCEGEADAIAALSAGWPAAMGTVGASPGALGMESLQKKLEGRDCVLFHHPDKAGRAWREKVGEALADARAQVCYVPPSPGKDLDERLRHQEEKQSVVAEMVKGALAWEDRRADGPQRHQEEKEPRPAEMEAVERPEVEGEAAQEGLIPASEGEKWLEEAVRAAWSEGAEKGEVTEQAYEANFTRLEAPLPSADVKKIVAAVCKKRTAGRKSRNYAKDGELVVQYLREKGEDLGFMGDAEGGGALMRYRAGVWRRCGRLDREVQSVCGGSTTVHAIGEIYGALCRTVTLHPVREWDRGIGTVLNVRNGLLDLASLRLRPHEKGALSTYQVPHEWQEGVEDGEVDSWLETSLPDEETRLCVLRMVADIIVGPRNNFRPALILHGPSGTGKTTLLLPVVALVGESAVAEVPLQALAENRFASAGLEGKRLGCFDDLPAKYMGDVSFVKAMTGGDPTFRVERKGVDAYDAPNNFRLMFCCNILPHAGDFTGAWSDRLVIVRLEKKWRGTSEDKKTLADDIKARRMPAFLRRCVDAYRAEPTESAAIGKNRRQYVRENDPVKGFLAERVKEEEGAFLPKPRSYAAFCNWSRAAGHREMSARAFHSRVKDALSIQEWRTKDGVEGVKGLRLLTAEELFKKI